MMKRSHHIGVSLPLVGDMLCSLLTLPTGLQWVYEGYDMERGVPRGPDHFGDTGRIRHRRRRPGHLHHRQLLRRDEEEGYAGGGMRAAYPVPKAEGAMIESNHCPLSLPYTAQSFHWPSCQVCRINKPSWAKPHFSSTRREPRFSARQLAVTRKPSPAKQ